MKHCVAGFGDNVWYATLTRYGQGEDRGHASPPRSSFFCCLVFFLFWVEVPLLPLIIPQIEKKIRKHVPFLFVLRLSLCTGYVTSGLTIK